MKGEKMAERKTSGTTRKTKQASGKKPASRSQSAPRKKKTVAELAAEEREHRNQMWAVVLFAVGILLTAFVSGVLQCLLFPQTALLGASGIVFMLIMLASLAGGTGGIPLTMLLVAALYLGDQIYDALFVRDNVANFMHLVGGVCGTVFGFAAGGRRRGRR